MKINLILFLCVFCVFFLHTDTDIDRPPVVASYPMSNETSGICLIINNVDFTKARAKKIKLGDRKGSDKDVGKCGFILSQLRACSHIE